MDRKELGEDASYLPDELVIDAWIDERGLVRRLRLPDSDTSTSMIDFFDFGVEVDVRRREQRKSSRRKSSRSLHEKECA